MKKLLLFFTTIALFSFQNLSTTPHDGDIRYQRLSDNQLKLIKAVKANDISQVEKLIQQKVAVNFVQLTRTRFTDHTDSRWDDASGLPLRQKAGVGQQATGMSPLMYAVWNKNIPMVELLLENGADADLWAYRSPSAVMLAYKSGNNELIALLEKYSRLDRKNLDKIKETASKIKALDKPYLGYWFNGIILYP